MFGLSRFTRRGAVEKSDSAVYSQEPVSDYWQALWRLVAYLEQNEIPFESGPLPFCVDLVAAIFWIDPERVRADLIKFRRAL